MKRLKEFLRGPDLSHIKELQTTRDDLNQRVDESTRQLTVAFRDLEIALERVEQNGHRP